jgi:acyl-coenzyme A synthetase/AMP-(fatty) acid ligase/acyl carrier protein
MTQRPGIVRDDLLFAVSTYSFDISVLELFLPLISGAVVYIAGNNILSDPQKIIDKIEEIRPTIIQATPGFYQMLFDTHWKGSRRLKVLYGGDLLPTPLAEKLLESSSSLWNMYGPTETTVWCTVKNILSAKDTDNIGRQINNVEIFILDKELNPVPIGVVGTIYIGGIGLAKGYYLNDDLTKQNFIASPFDHSRKIYETGDLGRWTAEGEIQFFGRRDNQVKVRGYRIELGEIECALQACKGIDAAVVAVKTTDEGEKELVGYVVSETEINIAEIRAHLSRTLPGYMVPGHYVQLQSLPLTPTGKVNRKKLPDPKGLQIFTGITYVAPRNEIQSKLAEIWSNLLGIEKEKIGINDNFFELGGHSLKAIKMIAQIKKQFTVGMNITDAFVHPTIESISAELGNVLWVKKNERRERDPDMEELLF